MKARYKIERLSALQLVGAVLLVGAGWAALLGLLLLIVKAVTR